MGRLGWLKNEENRRPTVAAVVAFAGPILGRPAEVGREIMPKRSPCASSLAGARAMVVAGIVSHDQNSIDLKKGRNDPIRGPQVLGNFSRVLELKMSVLGLGFYLAGKTRFI